MPVESITFESGFIVVRTDSGPPRQWAIADVLRAADIPALTSVQISSLKALANLFAILIRTLISRDILDESFLENGDMDLDTIVEVIDNMGGDYGDPDLTGSET